jgi:transposase
MLTREFTPEVIEALRHERFHHPHPHVQVKMEVLYLKSQGLPSAQIQRLCAISKATYYRYLEEYRTGGLARLKEIPVSPRESALQEYRGTLEAYFLAHPPATVAEAQAKMAALTGITRGPTQVRQFLHGLGMKPRKVGTIPAKADVEAQEAFKKKSGAALSPSPSW